MTISSFSSSIASKDKAPPLLRSRPLPDPPPFTIPPIPFESLTLTAPPEPPDPPDATFTFVLQVLDLESPASTMVLGTTSGVAPGVSTSRELSSTSIVRSTLLLCTCFSDLSLQSSCVEVSIFSALELVSLGHVSCSDLENLMFSMAIKVQGLEYQLEFYLSNSAIRALLVSLQDICVDMSVLVLLLAVLKPLSLQYAALRSLEDWTLDVDILVVVCFVDTAVRNVYNSDAFHRLASEFRVHLAQNLLSVSAYGVQLAHSRVGSVDLPPCNDKKITKVVLFRSFRKISGQSNRLFSKDLEQKYIIL
ncbi:hypothetical protein HID58_045864 [Brassica napus]|uniref:Uncharacterized protein n=1 Tax=Brassica napus TaxID=3708 RepID=A0ABQ8AUT1_BRANA|nr:hypothetical protein HID58_045864 [Brassica napus]